jgi:hypothetical protein
VPGFLTGCPYSIVTAVFAANGGLVSPAVVTDGFRPAVAVASATAKA